MDLKVVVNDGDETFNLPISCDSKEEIVSCLESIIRNFSDVIANASEEGVSSQCFTLIDY